MEITKEQFEESTHHLRELKRVKSTYISSDDIYIRQQIEKHKNVIEKYQDQQEIRRKLTKAMTLEVKIKITFDNMEILGKLATYDKVLRMSESDRYFGNYYAPYYSGNKFCAVSASDNKVYTVTHVLYSVDVTFEDIENIIGEGKYVNAPEAMKLIADTYEEMFNNVEYLKEI